MWNPFSLRYKPVTNLRRTHSDRLVPKVYGLVPMHEANFVAPFAARNAGKLDENAGKSDARSFCSFGSTPTGPSLDRSSMDRTRPASEKCNGITLGRDLPVQQDKHQILQLGPEAVIPIEKTQFPAPKTQWRSSVV